MRNVIVVPGSIIGTQTGIFSNSGSVQLGTPPLSININGMTIPVQQPPPTYSGGFTYDPMAEITSWYGVDIANLASVYVADSDIQYKFWHMREFSRFIEELSTDVVLVQRQLNQQSWKLLFAESNDWAVYTNAYSAKQKEHRIEIPDPVDMLYNERSNYGQTRIKSISDWASDNIKGLYTIHRVNTSIVAFVKNDTDAVLFKLCWLNA